MSEALSPEIRAISDAPRTFGDFVFLLDKDFCGGVVCTYDAANSVWRGVDGSFEMGDSGAGGWLPLTPAWRQRIEREVWKRLEAYRVAEEEALAATHAPKGEGE